MTDMVAFYPLELIEEVNKRIEKGFFIHTLVIWTKHPRSIFLEPVFSFLNTLKYRGTQLFIHLTITGMGGVMALKDLQEHPVLFEPHVPDFKDSLEIISELIAFVGKSDRIRLRIDPLIRIRDSFGTVYSNLPVFETIAESAACKGITNFSFSFLEKGCHKKVDMRFLNKGLEILSPNEEERERTSQWLSGIENKYQICIKACCVPGFKVSACIDGLFLEQIHNQQLRVSHKMPKSRALCGCTESVDIGGWPPKKCASGCLYCYASPKLDKC
jgi:hypothetical protein